MFYAHFVLAKKGPLARIWLAAHWDKKLTKAHVFETNIEKSVEGILQPKVKMALRTSGHLLLGVVRIYSRKAKYLLADCNEAFVKIKMAFRPGMVDLPEENREAAVNAITLPEVFHDFDTAMPDLNDVDLQSQFNMNQTRAEEITMREDYGNINLDTGDDGFGDMPSMEDTPSELRGGSVVNNLGDESLFREEPQPSTSNDVVTVASPGKGSVASPVAAQDDGFGGNLGGGEVLSGGLFEGGGLFSEPALDVTHKSTREQEIPSERRNSFSDAGDDYMDAHSPAVASTLGEATPRPGTPPVQANAVAAAGIVDPPTSDETPQIPSPPVDHGMDVTAGEHTTLLQNEEESFALAPVDASMMRGTVRTKRKRKLIVDDVKAIAGEEMKAQLSDTQDIVTTLDLAPPTKRLMHWKETGGVEKLFALPGRPLHARNIFKSYQSHLTSRPSENEVFGLLGDSEHENIQLDIVPGEEDHILAPKTPTKRGRKRKKEAEEEDSPEIPSPSRSTRSTRASEAAQEDVATAPADFPQQQVFNPNVEPEAPQSLQTPQHQGTFENLGYDASSTTDQQALADPTEPPPHSQMANLGWDEERGAPTPRAPSMGGATPFREDDFDGYPASVGPQSVRGAEEEEERGEEETQEEFEDRVLNKRAAHLNKILKSKLTDANSVVRLSDMTKRNNRKQAAQKFYSLLVLQKVMAIDLNQNECYGELTVSRGPKFETAVL